MGAADFPWTPPAVGDLEAPEGINETPSMCVMLETCPATEQARILAVVEEIAKEYAAQEEPEFLFFAAKKQGQLSSRIRGMCGLDSGDTLSRSDQSPCGPTLVRSLS